MTNENKGRLFDGGCGLSVVGLDCPVTRATQWLADAHETDILTHNQRPTTDNPQPITHNQQPPTTPYKCLRKKSRARFWAGR